MPTQVATYRARARSTLKRRRIEKRSPGASRAHTAAHTGSVWPHNTSATRGAAHDRRDLVRPRRLLPRAPALRRAGRRDVEDDRVWMTCTCGARILRAVRPFEQRSEG